MSSWKNLMKFRWNYLFIQYKIIILGFLIILSFSLFIFFYFIPLMEETYINNKKEMIKNIVKQSLATVEGVYQEYKVGAVTPGKPGIGKQYIIGKNKIWK